MPLKVFLTGATGFIGSRVARALVEAGHDVHALVRPTARRERLAALFPSPRTTHLTVVEGDLANPASYERALAELRPELAIHLAWYAEPARYLTAPENFQLVSATLALATRLADAGCPRLVAAGTCFEYDPRPGRLAEDAATAPASLYAACKLGLYWMLERFAANSRFSLAWLRFFHCYGPFEAEDRLVPHVIRCLLAGRHAAVTSGEQVRDFLHVEDLAGAVCAVAASDATGPVNVASGVPVTVRALVERVAAECGRPDLVDYGAIPRRDGDPSVLYANAARLNESIGFRPHFDLQSGVADTVRWYRARLDAHEQ